MKKLILSLTTFYLLSLPAWANPTKENEDSGFLQIDYLIVSKWDPVTNNWVNNTRQVYQFDEFNRVLGIVTLNINTNDPISRVSYAYDENGSMIEELFQNWINGEWINSIRYLMEYDNYARRTSLTIYIWNNNKWDYSSRQINYIYNEANLLISYDNDLWSGTEWYTAYYDNFTYDLAGNLIYRIRKNITGDQAFQIYYNYNDDNMRTQMLVQSWQKTTSTWIDSHRDLYYYNSCGIRIQAIRERFSNGSWKNEQNSEYFYKIIFPEGGSQEKVPICHKGHTVNVSVNAVDAHLAHGDCIGNCMDETKSVVEESACNDEMPVKPQIFVFPNPASHVITVRIENTD